jgi:energy-coupling factor transport system ATP-binding protein
MLKVGHLSFTHAHSSLPALSDVSFELEEGQALLVTGESGGGKSTLLCLLAGLYPRFLRGELSGSLSLDGATPNSISVWAEKAGYMTQNPESQFIAGNVEDELYLTLRCRNISGGEAKDLVEDRLRVFGLEKVRGNSVFQLSEGQKQKVVLASLTALKPRLLLLDEPSANLDPSSLAELGELLKILLDDKLSLVIADHRLAWLKELCGEILVLSRGSVSLKGSWDLLASPEKRQELGLRNLEIPQLLSLPRALVPSKGFREPKMDDDKPDDDKEGLEIDKLYFNYPLGPKILAGLSARLIAGKVTALIGPSGRGKTTLAKILCGLEKPASGTILFSGKKLDAIESQVVLQNSDHQLYMSTVLDEVLVALGGKKEQDRAEAMRILELFNLHHLADRHPQSLSGDEKQRLVVAVGLARPTRLLVLDEPTSGLDGRNLSLMAGEIKKVSDGGPCVLIITHDYDLINLTAEYVLDLSDGAFFGVSSPQGFDS